MSLLEDVFLVDEASEAQELERVIEGDGYDDDRPRSLPSDSDNNSEKEDEAEEDKRRVDPSKAKTKRVVKNPRVTLNPARLTGPRGIQIIPDHFKDFKFKGKGYEKEDLDLVLKKLEHWAYRLYPKFQFDDCLKKIETLGKKRPVAVHLHKIRSDQLLTEETVVQKDSSDDEEAPDAPVEDEFDKLLQQQIDIARTTPAPGSVKKNFEVSSLDKRSSLTMPKATSSPSISEEQRERILRNKRMAEEKRLARLKQMESTNDGITSEQNVPNELNKVKHRANVINSSDSEEETEVPMNQSVVADVHNTVQGHDEDNDDEIEETVTEKANSEIIDRGNNEMDLEETEPLVYECDINNVDVDNQEFLNKNDSKEEKTYNNDEQVKHVQNSPATNEDSIIEEAGENVNIGISNILVNKDKDNEANVIVSEAVNDVNKVLKEIDEDMGNVDDKENLDHNIIRQPTTPLKGNKAVVEMEVDLSEEY